MKRLRMGLLTAAVVAFAASAAVASATTITSPVGTLYTGEINAASEGHVILDNPIAKIECAWALSGNVKSHGSGATATISLTNFATTNCTNSWHYTTVSPGTWEIHWTSPNNGTVTWTGMTTESTRFGITCRYATSSTDYGLLTGKAPATIDINAAIPFHSGSGLCGEGATTLTGSLTVNTPASLLVDS